MITRRHALKLAAAFAAAAPAPFAASPQEAAALLDAPLSFDGSTLGGSIFSPKVLDPQHFAGSLDGMDFETLFDHGAPVEMAEYKQAFMRAVEAFGLPGRELPGDHPLHALDEAALALWCAAWAGGVRAGVAYEHLRLAMTAPVMVCATCHAHGALWGGRPYQSGDDGANRETCPDCGGRGTVPTPAPSLARLAAD